MCFAELEPSDLIYALESNNIFIELSTSNSNMRYGKPYYRLVEEFFMMIKDSKIPIAAGSDTHLDVTELLNIYDAADFINDLELTGNADIFMQIFGL